MFCIYTQEVAVKNEMEGHAAGDPITSLPKMALHMANSGNSGEHATLPLPVMTDVTSGSK